MMSSLLFRDSGNVIEGPWSRGSQPQAGFGSSPLLTRHERMVYNQAKSVCQVTQCSVPGDTIPPFGLLFTDGKIQEVGRWMHARRKFYEARTTDPPRAHQPLAWISLLYKVEEEAREKNLDDAQ